MSLINSLGGSYMNEWFIGALLMQDGKLHMIDRVRDDSIRTFSLTKDGTRWEHDTLGVDVLGGFEDLAWPKLGYRNIKVPNLGYNTVRFAQSQRSVHRGLRRDSIEWTDYPVQGGLIAQYDNTRDVSEAKCLFWPEFIPYTVGIKQIMNGEALAFAVNEDLAVGLSSTSASAIADIHFRQKVVGRVEEDGKIVLFNKTLRRSHFNKLMEAPRADL